MRLLILLMCGWCLLMLTKVRPGTAKDQRTSQNQLPSDNFQEYEPLFDLHQSGEDRDQDIRLWRESLVNHATQVLAAESSTTHRPVFDRVFGLQPAPDASGSDELKGLARFPGFERFATSNPKEIQHSTKDLRRIEAAADQQSSFDSSRTVRGPFTSISEFEGPSALDWYSEELGQRNDYERRRWPNESGSNSSRRASIEPEQRLHSANGHRAIEFGAAEAGHDDYSPIFQVMLSAVTDTSSNSAIDGLGGHSSNGLSAEFDSLRPKPTSPSLVAASGDSSSMDVPIDLGSNPRQAPPLLGQFGLAKIVPLEIIMSVASSEALGILLKWLIKVAQNETRLSEFLNQLDLIEFVAPQIIQTITEQLDTIDSGHKLDQLETLLGDLLLNAMEPIGIHLFSNPNEFLTLVTQLAPKVKKIVDGVFGQFSGPKQLQLKDIADQLLTSVRTNFHTRFNQLIQTRVNEFIHTTCTNYQINELKRARLLNISDSKDRDFDRFDHNYWYEEEWFIIGTSLAVAIALLTMAIGIYCCYRSRAVQQARRRRVSFALTRPVETYKSTNTDTSIVYVSNQQPSTSRQQ